MKDRTDGEEGSEKGSEKSSEKAGKPLYAQVKDHILDGISRGRYKAGERVPSEADLVTRFGISRMTANRALKELTESGFLDRIAGVGTFVAERRAKGDLIAIRDIADELAERGHVHSRDILIQEPVRASKALAERFELPPGAPLIHAKLLHRKDGTPVVIEDRHVNADVAPGYLTADLTRETSHSYLMRVAPLERVEHVIRAIAPTAEMKTLLELDEEEPCLLVQRRTWARGVVASVAKLIHAGYRYEIAGRFEP